MQSPAAQFSSRCGYYVLQLQLLVPGPGYFTYYNGCQQYTRKSQRIGSTETQVTIKDTAISREV